MTSQFKLTKPCLIDLKQLNLLVVKNVNAPSKSPTMIYHSPSPVCGSRRAFEIGNTIRVRFNEYLFLAQSRPDSRSRKSLYPGRGPLPKQPPIIVYNSHDKFLLHNIPGQTGYLHLYFLIYGLHASVTNLHPVIYMRNDLLRVINIRVMFLAQISR